MEVDWMDASWDQFDALKGMMVIVTLISTLVHLYSTEYMSHDHIIRFMSYLSLLHMAVVITAELGSIIWMGGVGLLFIPLTSGLRDMQLTKQP